ncbi:MAG: CarD family transcriptional regulator [Oscillospiraceae bacterium]
MYKIGDHLIYSTTGVCVVDDIRTEKIMGENKRYYILKSVFGNGVTVFAPIGTSEDKMKDLLSKEEVEELIDTMPMCDVPWIDNDNIRKETFNEILKGGNHHEIMNLIKALYSNRTEKLQSGRKFLAVDEKVMKEAERIIYEEFAFVLDINPNEVLAYIDDKIALKEGQNT